MQLHNTLSAKERADLIETRKFCCCTKDVCTRMGFISIRAEKLLEINSILADYGTMKGCWMVPIAMYCQILKNRIQW
tara:strand:- start:2277 stop:2507 length:231 start_codon:yes stop_codon:yes gene_type:complete